MVKSRYDGSLAEGRELTAEWRSLTPTLFRETELAALAKSVAAGRSVLLVGAPGIGKTSVAHALSGYLAQSGPRKLYEFASIQLLSGTVYLGEWQTKVTAVLQEAAASKAVLYFTDIWNLPDLGRTTTQDTSVWDALRPRLLNGELQIIGEVTEEQLLGLKALPGFLAPFDIVEVSPLRPEQVVDLLRAEAARIHLEIDASGIARLLELCQQFLPFSAGPGPASRLLGQIRHYRDEKRGIGEVEPIDPAFVEKVFAVYTGLPHFVVSRRDVRPLAEISDWFQSRIVGQRDAIAAVVQMITLFKAGLHDARRPIGSFLFVGPTGVGKTELARALSVFLFGSEKRLLRFDLSEFKDYHSFEMLLGDPKKPERPARLVDPVRSQPFQVVLLDEIEKAHPNIWDLLLQVLDDGRLTPASGPVVNFRNTIVIATANVGAQALAKPSLGFTGAAAGQDDARLHTELEAVFRPELLNRFQHIVRFRALTQGEVREIARAELRRLLEREGIVGRQLAVDVDEEVLDLVVTRGYDAKYGARALKRELQQRVIMPIATLLMERRVEDASILRLTARNGEVKVAVLESESTRERKRVAQPLRLVDGRKVGRETLVAQLDAAGSQLEAIRGGIGLPSLQQERDNLEIRRHSGDLWSDTRAAAALLDRCDRIDQIISRIGRLEAAQSELGLALSSSSEREMLARLAENITRHAGFVEQAHRELLVIGRFGYGDALIECAPLAHARPMRDLLFETYAAWAEQRNYRMLLIREPMSDDEPLMMAIFGAYAYGYLRGEAGHHRLRIEQDTYTAKVGVAEIIASTASGVPLSVQKALKQMGQLGHRVRSRVELRNSAFVVQNAGSLAESRELAEAYGPSWIGAAQNPDTIVRRYDQMPFLLKDHLTGTHTGRAEILQPQPFHELLCQRIDVVSSAK